MKGVPRSGWVKSWSTSRLWRPEASDVVQRLQWRHTRGFSRSSSKPLGGPPWHQSVVCVCLLLCQLDVLFVSVSSVSGNSSLVFLLFGLVVSALSKIRPAWLCGKHPRKKKPVGKGRQKLFGEIHLPTELPKKTSRPWEKVKKLESVQCCFGVKPLIKLMASVPTSSVFHSWSSLGSLTSRASKKTEGFMKPVSFFSSRTELFHVIAAPDGPVTTSCFTSSSPSCWWAWLGWNVTRELFYLSSSAWRTTENI